MKGSVIENPEAVGLRRSWRNAGAPTSGASGTLYNRADPGDILIDTTNKKIYVNTNTKASPTWSQILTAGVAFTGDLAITGDVGITGDIDVGSEDVSVDQGRFVYLDGQDGAEYITSDTAGDLMINATTNINLAIGGTDEVRLTATVLSPATSDGVALGSATLMWGDLFLASGAVINFNNGDVTITHSANVLAFAGGTSYTFDVAILPSATDGAALGSATVMWSDLFLASGGVINFNNGNMTITHSAGDLAVAGGTLTTAGIIVGTVATGIDFTGTYTGNCIDFTDITIDHTGSNGPCMIRAGTYASPVANADEDQSGMIRLYGETSADGSSYDRGVFVCLKTTGIKGIFPIAGLAEVLAQTGNGPTKVQAAQFICHLNSATAKLAALGGDSTAGMYGGWFKITANEGATTASGSRAAPIWIDNQLYGSNINAGMEEYGIFATTGGSKPKAFIGFETTSSGWTNLLYFDETAYDQDPIFSTGTCKVDASKDSTGTIKIDLNGTTYYIGYWAAADLTS